ncbi:mediator complex, subunit Med5 [Exophiala viscosa]|uniref:mediator complex, subunit Med5 n=1 Tax=Exophiala viscosa TaxID=2486360 RepID=UPI002192AE2A|nr:mediator complex, subunit Med5 [Exophiala viscosa]
MAISKVSELVRYCLLRRTSVDEFGTLVQTYQAEFSGKRLFAALIECRFSFCAPGDPLISLYLDHVGTTGVVSISDALVVMVRRWNSDKGAQAQNALQFYNQTLQDITMVTVSNKYKTTPSEARTSILLSSRWLATLARQTSQDVEPALNIEHSHVLESLAFLVASMAATDAGLEALSLNATLQGDTSEVASQDLRASLRQALNLCLPLYSTLSTHLMDRLNTVLKHISLLEHGSTQNGGSSGQSSEIQVLQFQVSIPDTHMVAARAATIAYLEAMLTMGSTIDDGTLINYLCSRHQNDYQAVSVDLLISAFQILKTKSVSPRSLLSYQQCRTFVQNKLPNILSMLSASSFNSFDTQQTITDAWTQVVPQLSGQEIMLIGFHFLHTCSLHHLLTQQAAIQLVGNEEALSGMSKGLYTKDDLVSQVMGNHTRGPKLVEELVRSDGSAGFISQAIVEIMHNYCQNKETQYLKDLANAIIRRPAAINCISLFIRPSYWLGPLCTLLDEWRWDEIHGEAQPVYDEFGAVLLLVLVTKARLQLPQSELGIRKKDGFLSEYMNNGDSEQELGSLSEVRMAHLGNWINALYLAEGLSDELFTNCSPHDFYILIPTLLRQSMTAYQQDKLTQDSLKAGLDYLLEPFLLPSLASALSWIANILHDEAPAAAVILDVIMKAPGNTDSRDIHRTILAMCGPQLQKIIDSMQPEHDQLHGVQAILKQSPIFSFSPDQGVEHSQIASVLQEGIVSMITSAGASVMQEQSTSSGIHSMVNCAINSLGLQSALRVLLAVLLQMSDSPDFLFALDTVSTIVCTVDRGLRETLRLLYTNLGTLLKKGDTLSAEAVVRLHRQVEAYANLLTVQEMGLDAFAFAQQLTNIDTADPNLDATTAVSGAMDLQGDQEPADGIDQVLDEVAAMGNLDSNDADMNFDALYGLQNTDMDLNDLDLDMF